MNTPHLNSWVSCTVFFGALFFSTLVLAAPPIEVVLKVTAVPTLEVLTNSSSCSGATDDPCIDVPFGHAPFIKFKLPNACGDETGDPTYELTGMRITMIDKVWPTVSNPLNGMVAKDFKADPSTGEIDFQAGKNRKGPKMLKLKDNNKHGYTVFYEITASPCDDSSDAPDIYLDPEIRNKGGSN